MRFILFTVLLSFNVYAYKEDVEKNNSSDSLYMNNSFPESIKEAQDKCFEKTGKLDVVIKEVYYTNKSEFPIVKYECGCDDKNSKSIFSLCYNY